MSLRSADIRLHHPDHARTVGADDVYFTFASGRFTYDCVTCGAKCCRGYGYIATVAHELDRQLRSRPGLPLFVEHATARAGHYKVTNCPPACFFLSDDGLCEVHAEHGFDAKPETCRLFPFNYTRRAGRYLVVGPHLGLCPLEVTLAASMNQRSDHHALLEAMAAHGISASVPSTLAGAEDLGAVIATERRIVAASERFLETGDYVGFAREQVHLTSHGSEDEAKALASLTETERQVRELLAIDPAATNGGDRDLVRTMVASTAHLRSLIVFQPALSNSPKGLPLDRSRIAHSLLCLYLIAAAARHAGMTRVTYQTLIKLDQDFRALIRVLVRADSVMVWQRRAPIDLRGFETPEQRLPFLRLAKALLPSIQRSQGASLGHLLREHAPAEPLARILFLKLASKRLAGQIVPAEEEGLSAYPLRRLGRIGNAFHRWVLGNADEGTLQLSYDRLDAMRGAARRSPPM